MSDPTPDIVRGLWAHMTQRYGSKVADKTNAPLMELIAGAMQLFGVDNASDFLKNFTTTIATTIYVPFEIGDDSTGWSLWDQIVICAHEHEHVLQWQREGVAFAAKYLASSGFRAAYEAEAYRSEAELSWWRTRQVAAPTTLAAHLTAYRCSQADMNSAAQIIELSEATIERGGIINPPTAAVIDWLNTNAPSLRST